MSIQATTIGYRKRFRQLWKPVTFLAGIGLLFLGAGHAPDWDYGVSVVMAGITYPTADWSLRVVISRRWRMLPLAAFWTWLAVDGSYWLYWSLVKPSALEMREVNWPASLCLYVACGLVWLLPEMLKGRAHPERDLSSQGRAPGKETKAQARSDANRGVESE